ncbi:MAG: hypothetical protein ACFB0E_14105 [Leptolyngbyaceae cyanobacterium]
MKSSVFKVTLAINQFEPELSDMLENPALMFDKAEKTVRSTAKQWRRKPKRKPSPKPVIMLAA